MPVLSPRPPRETYHTWTEAERLELLRLADEGVSFNDMAKAIGVTHWACRLQLRRLRKQGIGEDLLRGPPPGLPRCACGLLLPCNDCLVGTLDRFAAMRRGSNMERA